MDFNIIQNDLLELDPFDVELPVPLYDETLSQETNFKNLYRKLQRYSNLKNRQMTLYYGYQLGLLISKETVRAKRSLLKSQMTIYFYMGSTRTFQLFEPLGVEQIFRTKIISLQLLRNMKALDFRSLCL